MVMVFDHSLSRQFFCKLETNNRNFTSTMSIEHLNVLVYNVKLITSISILIGFPQCCTNSVISVNENCFKKIISNSNAIIQNYIYLKRTNLCWSRLINACIRLSFSKLKLKHFAIVIKENLIFKYRDIVDVGQNLVHSIHQTFNTVMYYVV